MLNDLKENTLKALLDRSFESFPALPALGNVGESPLSFSAVKDKVIRLAYEMQEYHLKPGDRAAILGDNCPNWVIAYLASVYTGIVVVPIMTTFPVSDIAHILKETNASLLFTTSKFKAKLLTVKRAPLPPVIDLDTFELMKRRGPDQSSALRKSAPKSQTRKAKPSLPVPKPGDLAAIIYTSGTTGHSKGVMLTHENITTDILFSLQRFPLTPQDRFLSILPLAHTFEATGGMLCPLATGVSIFYMQGLPTPDKLLSSMKAVQPTGVLTVPLVMEKIFRKRILPKIEEKALIRSLYKNPLFRKPIHKKAGRQLIQSLGGQLRFFMFGGASLNNDVETFLRDARILYSTGYGMTETSPILTINPFGQVKVGSCGKAIPGITLKIHNPDPETGIGEIIVRGPIVMKGYYKKPAETKEIFMQGGWLKTGDLGYFDSDGYLFIRGRSKNVIIGPNGENIYPEIIEQKLTQVPFIPQAVVYQSSGKLVAKVNIDADALKLAHANTEAGKNNAEIEPAAMLETVRRELNNTLPPHSTLNRIIEHKEPFELTPTNKVKRFLYID